MPALSVVVCSYNSAATIESTCRSAAWADELLVVDSGSTDGTLDVARSLAGRVLVEPFRGYSAQKQWAVAQARHDWVFILDHDEEISSTLAEELRSLPARRLEAADVLMCRRRNWVMGRRVRSWEPDWQSRLFDRRRAVWADDLVNDARRPSGPGRVGRLRGWLEHRRQVARFKDFFDGRLADQRLVLSAAQLQRRGRSCRWADLALRPGLTFLKHYLLKGAVLDGLFGLMMAQRAALAVQLKYSALWAMERGMLSLDEVDARGDRRQAG